MMHNIIYSTIVSKARKVVLSDLPEILPLLCKNARTNGLKVCLDGESGTDEVVVAECRWGPDVSSFVAEHGPFDVILGADVIFKVKNKQFVRLF